jgi:hypothetical protein
MTGGMALRATSSVRAPSGSGHQPDESTMDFLRDLIEPFGQKVDEDLFRRGNAVSHQDLIDLLLRAEDVRNSKPQLVIVTHALPDVLPFTAVGPYLAKRLDCEATTFAIAQQGLAAPFTGLRIAAAHHRAGRCAEVVLTVLEQTTLPTAIPLVQDTPLVDSGVAMVFGAGTGPRLGWVASSPSAAALIRRAGPDTLVVLGPWVDRSGLDGFPVHQVEPGTYCTSVWLALASHWREWPDRRFLLCDTDPLTGQSHAALFENAER